MLPVLCKSATKLKCKLNDNIGNDCTFALYDTSIPILSRKKTADTQNPGLGREKMVGRKE
jgi:hypothetical protein